LDLLHYDLLSDVSFISAGLNLKTAIEKEIQDSGISVSEFGDLAGKMSGQLVYSRSDNTNIKYLSYFNKWKSFISSKGGLAVPASPIHVALYLTDLIDKHVSSSVISASLYSIKWAHSLRNLPDPTANACVKNLLESAKRTLSKPVSRKEPISLESLKELCEKYSNNTDLLVLRDLCMISWVFNGFLRFNELVNLRCDDIQFFNEYFTITIRKSKTDQYRNGESISLRAKLRLARILF